MKKIILSLIILSILSCKRDCTLTIRSVKFYPVTRSKTNLPTLQDWYKTNYLTGEVNFLIELSSSGGGEFCKYRMVNPIEENSIKVFCNKSLTYLNDTILAYSNIVSYFDRNKYIHETYLDQAYLLTLIPKTNTLKFKNETYTISVETSTTMNETFKDSCIVKFN